MANRKPLSPAMLNLLSRLQQGEDVYGSINTIVALQDRELVVRPCHGLPELTEAGRQYQIKGVSA
jgi:hypothetical protein